MKRSNFLMYILCLIGYYSFSQNTIPVERLVDYAANDDKGLDDDNISFIKDINGKLTKFEGKWKGTYEGRTFLVDIFKTTVNHSVNPKIEEDELQMKYKILNNDGSVYEDIENLPNTSPFVVKGRYLYDDEKYYFSFYGGQDNCGLDGDLVAFVVDDQMSLTLFGTAEMLAGEDCPKIREVFPDRKSIVLSKQ